jgi:hypothetical protein
MTISFVFIVVFLVIQICGKIWQAQVAFCVKSCVELNLPRHPPSSLLCTLVWDGLLPRWFQVVDGTGIMRNGMFFCGGAHDAHHIIHPAPGSQRRSP